MKKKLCFICFLFFQLFFAYGQGNELLKGNIIRYHTNKYSSKNAFDNNPNTYFKAYIATGSWVGLDLGRPHVITQIEFMSGYNNMQTGIFEGANDPSFKDAFPLYLIKYPTSDKIIYRADVSISKGFRYVRYMGAADSYCVINELGFYGYPGEGDDSQYYQITNLPTVVINTDNKKEIESKEEYLVGNISIISDNGALLHNCSMDIKGRGNASWTFPKKGFRVKLNKKERFLDATSKSKNWVLVPDYRDKTQIRSELAFAIGEKMGFDYVPYNTSVDLIVNGDYRGTYRLMDKIEVDKNRVNIEKLSPLQTALPELSGGYLIEIDGYAQYEPVESRFYSSKYAVPVTIKSPKNGDIVGAQKKYINNHFNKFEDALFSSNFRDPVAGYRKYLDVESFINYFLTEELTGNPDAFWSTYMTKDRNSDKFVVGPIWDFDIAFDNRLRVYPTNQLGDYICLTQGARVNNILLYLNRLLSDSDFQRQMREQWKDARESKGITRDYLQSEIKSLKNKVEESAELNLVRWKILNKELTFSIPPQGSYLAEVDNVSNFIFDRITWLDDKLEYKASDSDAEKLTPVKLSGFNSDVVAEASPIKQYASRGLDYGTNVCFTPNISAKGALPYDGIIRSSIPNSYYQLASYSDYNASYIKSETTEQLYFEVPHRAYSLGILASSTHGLSRVKVNIKYTDGTIDETTIFIHDWVNNGKKSLIPDLKKKEMYQNGAITDFGIYEYIILTDATKEIESLSFINKESSRPFIFAISSQKVEPESRFSSFASVSDTDNSKDVEYSIYPNPVFSYESIHIEANEEISNLRIFSMQNNALVKSVKVNANQMQIPLNGLASGFYIVEITTVNKTMSQKIMVK